jgi:hypothetical protein
MSKAAQRWKILRDFVHNRKQQIDDVSVRRISTFGLIEQRTKDQFELYENIEYTFDQHQITLR